MRTTARALFLRIGWHGMAILALSCLPVIKWDLPWWQISRRQLLPAVLLIGAYACSALLVAVFVRTRDLRAIGRALAITLSVFAVCLFGLMLLQIAAPRYLLVPAFLAAIVLIPLSAAGPRLNRAGWGACVLASAAALFFAVRAVAVAEGPTHEVQRSYLKTAFYHLQVTSHEGVVPAPATRGGGLNRIGDRVLLGTGDGHLYLLDVATADGVISVEALPTLVPSNRDEFAVAFGGSSRSPVRHAEWTEKGPPRVQTWRFRVADVITQQRGDRVRVYASHHYWKADEQCFIVRVSMVEASAADLGNSLRDARWHSVFDSTPCVPLEGDERKRGKNPFKGEEVGGRLTLLDENTLLLTVGDHGFYGLESLQIFAQDPHASYGKTIRIDLTSGASEVFTLGHRNPQGLFVTAAGKIWLSEHGPQGGDEINLLAAGSNYGWPRVTYGTEYDALVWPLSQQQGRHEGFVQPRYAWTPSIGVSTLIEIQANRFPIWRGDLLVGSLATRSLYRLVLDGDRIVLDEPIPLGRRVRDVLEMADGRLLVWTDDAALLTVEPSSESNIAATFATLCMGCHQAVDGISHRIGPDLYGVLGRGIADAPGYGEFSAALRSRSGRWTRAQLDAFLRDPQAFAPGTTMAFEGIKDNGQRTKIVDYLARLGAEEGS